MQAMQPIQQNNQQQTTQQMNLKLIKTLVYCQNLHKQDCEITISKLQLLLEQIKFLKLSRRNFQSKIQIVALYNISAAYQSQWKIEECIKYIEQTLKVLTKECKKQSNNYKSKLLYLKIRLQLCAILSQNNQHEKGINYMKQNLLMLSSLFQKGLIYWQSKKKDVCYEILLQLCQMKKYQQILQEKMVDSKYFWKHIPENNNKTIKKQYYQAYDIKSQRNILGKRINENWIQKFTIGDIMLMKAIHYPYFVEEQKISQQFNQKNIIQKIFILSATYFSIATQMRFLEKQKDLKVGKKSQIFHLKAIETICKFIKQSVFINHLINSYYKHYANQLPQIQQQQSKIQYSLINQSKNPRQIQYNDNLNNYYEDRNNNMQKNTTLFLNKKLQNTQKDYKKLQNTQKDSIQKCIKIGIERKNINKCKINKHIKQNENKDHEQKINKNKSLKCNY